MASIALEPAPADPEAAVPVVVSLASVGLFAALVATAVAAGNRHPSAAIAAVVTGLLALGFTVSCPVSGHHAFGAWWFGQMALTLPMLGVRADPPEIHGREIHGHSQFAPDLATRIKLAPLHLR